MTPERLALCCPLHCAAHIHTFYRGKIKVKGYSCQRERLVGLAETRFENQ